MPISLQFSDGTSSISAETKSASVMPYLSLRILRTFNFTLSDSFSYSLPDIGIVPAIAFICSPVSALAADPSICFCARWMRISGIRSDPSFSSSPQARSIFEPSALIILPCMASGMLAHWYFFIPP